MRRIVCLVLIFIIVVNPLKARSLKKIVGDIGTGISHCTGNVVEAISEAGRDIRDEKNRAADRIEIELKREGKDIETAIRNLRDYLPDKIKEFKERINKALEKIDSVLEKCKLEKPIPLPGACQRLANPDIEIQMGKLAVEMVNQYVGENLVNKKFRISDENEDYLLFRRHKVFFGKFRPGVITLDLFDGEIYAKKHGKFSVGYVGVDIVPHLEPRDGRVFLWIDARVMSIWPSGENLTVFWIYVYNICLKFINKSLDQKPEFETDVTTWFTDIVDRDIASSAVVIDEDKVIIQCNFHDKPISKWLAPHAKMKRVGDSTIWEKESERDY